MNLRITSFIAYEGEGDDLAPLVSEICEVLKRFGYGNSIPDPSSATLNSLVIVRENTEILELGPEGFFQAELDGSILPPFLPMLDEVIYSEEETGVGTAGGEG